MKDSSRKAPAGLSSLVESFLQWHEGAGKAVGRDRLLEQCQSVIKCDDTELRLAIQELRERGVMICNNKDGHGYFLAGTVQEYESWRNRYRAVAVTILRATDATDRTAHKRFDYNPLQGKLF